MYEELVKCSDLLTQFGGHPMAAGLSMEEKNVELFRRRLNDNCTLTEQDLIPKIMILSLIHISLLRIIHLFRHPHLKIRTVLLTLLTRVKQTVRGIL